MTYLGAGYKTPEEAFSADSAVSEVQRFHTISHPRLVGSCGALRCLAAVTGVCFLYRRLRSEHMKRYLVLGGVYARCSKKKKRF